MFKERQWIIFISIHQVTDPFNYKSSLNSWIATSKSPKDSCRKKTFNFNSTKTPITSIINPHWVRNILNTLKIPQTIITFKITAVKTCMKTLLTKSWTISSKITNPNPSKMSVQTLTLIKNKVICIRIQAIFTKIQAIICIKIKITSILSYNIHNQIKTFNQLHRIINQPQINRNLHLLFPDKITSSHKISDNYKNKNFKIPPHSNKILSYPNSNPSKDPSKPNNKNPSSIKDNFKNLNYNNNLHSIKILSGVKTKTDHNKNPIQIKTVSIINSFKM